MNIHWSSHTTNAELYDNLPLLSSKIASRRMQLAGHCHRHPELTTQRLVLWQPSHGQPSRGRPRVNFIDTLKRDAGVIDPTELASLMEDRHIWKSLVVARLRAP